MYTSKRQNLSVYRFRCKCRRFLRRQAARLEPPTVCEYLYPLPMPRELLPADVRPRNSRCFMTALQIQLIFGSRRIALCDGSTNIISKYLYEESWATQYEFRTRSPPKRRPTRSCKMETQHYISTPGELATGNEFQFL